MSIMTYCSPVEALRAILRAHQDEHTDRCGLPSPTLSEALDALESIEARLTAREAALEAAAACRDWIGGLGTFGFWRVSPPLDLMDALARFDDVCPCL